MNYDLLVYLDYFIAKRKNGARKQLLQRENKKLTMKITFACLEVTALTRLICFSRCLGERSIILPSCGIVPSMAIRFLLSSSSKPPPLMQNPIANPPTKPLLSFVSRIPSGCCPVRREIVVSIVSLTTAFALGLSPLDSLSEVTDPPPREPVLAGIANTKSWFQFYGDGFSIRVPPLFEDIMEPEVMKRTIFRMHNCFYFLVSPYLVWF